MGGTDAAGIHAVSADDAAAAAEEAAAAEPAEYDTMLLPGATNATAVAAAAAAAAAAEPEPEPEPEPEEGKASYIASPAVAQVLGLNASLKAAQKLKAKKRWRRASVNMSMLVDKKVNRSRLRHLLAPEVWAEFEPLQNSDGQLDAGALSTLLERLGRKKMSKKEIKKAMAQLDPERTGQITLGRLVRSTVTPAVAARRCRCWVSALLMCVCRTSGTMA